MAAFLHEEEVNGCSGTTTRPLAAAAPTYPKMTLVIVCPRGARGRTAPRGCRGPRNRRRSFTLAASWTLHGRLPPRPGSQLLRQPAIDLRGSSGSDISKDDFSHRGPVRSWRPTNCAMRLPRPQFRFCRTPSSSGQPQGPLLVEPSPRSTGSEGLRATPQVLQPLVFLGDTMTKVIALSLGEGRRRQASPWALAKVLRAFSSPTVRQGQRRRRPILGIGVDVFGVVGVASGSSRTDIKDVRIFFLSSTTAYHLLHDKTYPAYCSTPSAVSAALSSTTAYHVVDDKQ